MIIIKFIILASPSSIPPGLLHNYKFSDKLRCTYKLILTSIKLDLGNCSRHGTKYSGDYVAPVKSLCIKAVCQSRKGKYNNMHHCVMIYRVTLC